MPSTRSAGTAALLLCLAAACSEAAPPAPAGGEAPLLESIAQPVEGAAVHLVRLEQTGGRYLFAPATLEIPSGDVVRFLMTGSQPESIVFEMADSAAPAAEFVRLNALQRGVVLTEAGMSYDVSFAGAPAGEYRFHSIPHQELGMRGVIRVVAPGAPPAGVEDRSTR